MPRIAIVLLTGTLLACMTPRGGGRERTSNREVHETESGEKLVCQREHVTGSNIPKKVCRYESDRRQQREAAQDAMRQRSQNAKPGEGP